MKHIAFIGLVVMLFVLATATVLEKIVGGDAARAIYDSWPFFALWAVIAVAASVYIVKRHLYLRPMVMLLHVSLLVILLGAATTWLTAERGKMQLPTNQQVKTYTDAKGNECQLPFSLSLKNFSIETYPGTQAPMDFVSHLVVTDGTETTEGEASMNHIFSYDGYRFFQSGYDAEGKGTILSVQHDVWGIGITYVGYALLLIACIALLFSKHGRFRTLLKQATLVVALVACTSASASAEPRVLPKDVAERMGNIYVLYNDRMCPFQTLARDFTMKLCGSNSYHGFTAEQVATGWMFYFEDWSAEPMIKVKSAAVCDMMHLDGKKASFNDFLTGPNGYILEDEISKIMKGEEVDDVKGIQRADEQFQIATMMANGSLIKIFPARYQGKLNWYSQVSEDIPSGIDVNQYTFIRKGLNYLNELIVMENWTDAGKFVDKLREYQLKEGGNELPSEAKFKAEKAFNAISNTLWVAAFCIIIGLVLFVYQSRLMVSGKQLGKRVKWAAYAAVALVFVYLMVFLALLWYIAGHMPLSNGGETMMFMSWASVVLTIAFARRFTMSLPFGILVAGLSMMVAALGEGNPQLTPLMPVLQSPLLCVHVVIVMLAYALLAFLMLNGILACVLRHNEEQVKQLHIVGQLLLIPAVIMLAIGIFIGAIWANVSWGTYWSWDPKEVWALITFIIYAFAIHSVSIPRFSKPMFFHIYCILAFLSVLITYFGVNFLLGGMHSYA